MSREELLLERVRGWARQGLIREPRIWLDNHGLVPLLPELYGEAEAREWARRNVMENLYYLAKAQELIVAFREAGVRVVPLKGIDLLDRVYHGRESHRRTGDVDLLVDSRRLGPALETMERLGYRFIGEAPKADQIRWYKDIPYEGPRKIRVEIHQELFLDMGFTLTWEELRRKGQLEEGRGLAGSDRLSLDALTVHLLVHMTAHRFGGESLRWVLDILLLLDRFEKDYDARRIVDVAKQLRGKRAAGAAVAAIRHTIPGVDLGPLAALSTGGARERWALRLIDPVRAALEGPAGWTKRNSVLCRILLDPGPGATMQFVWRKWHIRRNRGTAAP